MQTTIRLALIILSSAIAIAQVGTWEKISTLTEIRMMLPQTDEVIMASDGGLLVFDKTSGLFRYGLNDELTENLDLHSTYIDSENLLWIGARSPGPIVEVLDLNRNTFLDVEFVDLNETNSFVQVGDSVYATYQDGVDGGLLLYRKGAESIDYLDIFNNFPGQNNLNLGQSADVGYTGSKIFFRTDDAVIWAEADGRNLKDPVNWNVNNLPGTSEEITSIIPGSDSLLIAAGQNIYSYDFATFTSLFLASSTIIDMVGDVLVEDQVVIATSAGVASVDLRDGSQTHMQTVRNIKSIEMFDSEVWIASTNDFLSVYSGQEYQAFTANRPRDHQFTSMIVDAAGQLIGGASRGFSIYSIQGWRTITSGSYNSDFDEDAYNWDEMIIDTLDYNGNAVVEDMVLDGNGNTFFALQGRGVFKLDDDPPGESRFYSPADGSIEPTYDSDTYVLPGQMAVDSKQNLWATTKFVQEGGSVISILTPDGEVYHISQYQGGLDSRSVKSIAIDANDMAWLGSQVRTELQASGGIHFIDIASGEPGPNMELNVSSLQMLGTPLASNEIWQLEIAPNNTLWILTPSGVQSMPLPNQWLTTAELKNHANLYMTEKQSDFYYYWQLTDYNVTSMEIDQRGNHWFLSDNAGVHVLQENGRWINGGYGYNTSNSGLLDNEIYSAAFDAETGQAYFSTPKGISVLNTPFAEPKETYSSLHIYPQPFNPDIHDKVIIQGLMDNSSVRILTIHGALVRELTYLNDDVQGYEAQWDGRDSAGDKVGSGVYILFFFNDEGEAASHKLAILR